MNRSNCSIWSTSGRSCDWFFARSSLCMPLPPSSWSLLGRPLIIAIQQQDGHVEASALCDTSDGCLGGHSAYRGGGFSTIRVVIVACSVQRRCGTPGGQRKRCPAEIEAALPSSENLPVPSRQYTSI